MKRIAVFCGSSPGADPAFGDLAEAVGRGLAERGLGLVYGGGRLGLMGRVADAALAAGGEAIGVIPRALVAAEAAHPGLTRLEVVETMHERKGRMTELADGFVVLPGGIGTLEEMFEVLSWAQLGYHAKPVGLLAAGEFWAPLLAFLESLVAAGFVRPAHRANLLVADTLEALLESFARFVPGPALARIGPADL